MDYCEWRSKRKQLDVASANPKCAPFGVRDHRVLNESAKLWKKLRSCKGGCTNNRFETSQTQQVLLHNSKQAVRELLRSTLKNTWKGMPMAIMGQAGPRAMTPHDSLMDKH